MVAEGWSEKAIKIQGACDGPKEGERLGHWGYATGRGMRLNPKNCKEMIVNTLKYQPIALDTAKILGFCGYCQSHVLRPPDRHIGVELENIQIRTLAKVKRARAPTKLYPNSSLTFHPLIKLVHEIELNPGPQNFSVKDSGGKNANSMKLANLNALSLKRREQFILVEETILENKFHVFTVEETWLDDSISDLNIEIPGYHLFQVDRQKRGGEVCIYVSHSYKTELLSDISNMSTNGFHQLWLKVQVKNMKSVLVCAVYRPPDLSIDFFDADLSPNSVTASLLNKPIYIIGDLNCNLLKPNIPESVSLMNFCRMFSLNQMVSSPNRVTDSTATLLDVIITSNLNKIRDVKIIESSVNDHDLVYAILRLKKQRPKPVYITTRCFKHYQTKAFFTDIEQAPWSVLDVFDDVNDKLFAFNEFFCDIVDRHAHI
ncbi:hypothetical protein AWC38_SpisGene21387 [Stylophora pistillata]|uniref:Endonuclease/exonuclease/phosphatase domain-containing protein n=1 Tax=Stylophora pistillata TaxID=50429 RepID=A0A2B4RCC9_STYPI|nr:hypothetical protein AWC38_SpisGene21387 [Stylophora pistillata]